MDSDGEHTNEHNNLMALMDDQDTNFDEEETMELPVPSDAAGDSLDKDTDCPASKTSAPASSNGESDKAESRSSSVADKMVIDPAPKTSVPTTSLGSNNDAEESPSPAADDMVIDTDPAPKTSLPETSPGNNNDVEESPSLAADDMVVDTDPAVSVDEAAISMAQLQGLQESLFQQTEDLDPEIPESSSGSKGKSKRGANDQEAGKSNKKARKDDKPAKPLWEQTFEEQDEEGKEAAADFKRKAKEFYKKSQKVELSMEEDIEFTRLVVNEEQRRIMVEADRTAMEDEQRKQAGEMEETTDEQQNRDDATELFVRQEPELLVAQDNFPDHQQRPGGLGKSRKQLKANEKEAENSEDSEDGEEDEARVDDATSEQDNDQPPPKKRRSKQQRHAVTAAIENIHELEARKARKRGPRKTTAKPRKPRVSSAHKQKGSEAAKGKKKAIGSMNNFTSLGSADVFRDATFLAEGEKDAGGRVIGKGNKYNAMKNMIASIPAEHRDEGTFEIKDLVKASSRFTGHGVCRLDGAFWILKGMSTPLRHFQMTGASWMREREAVTSGPKGGIVADSMGMGKTVTVLANIVNGIPPMNHKGTRATLVIVPSSIIHQWFAEINFHCDTKIIGNVFMYTRGGKGLQALNQLQMLESSTIVLTTYGEIIKSCPKINFPKELQTQIEKEEWLYANRHNHRGLFHKIDWYRVVVDEAHCMKNHLSLTSLALRELMAKYRWAITATPIHNNTRELYPYFKFLQVNHTGNYKIFASNYDANTSTGKRRLLAQLNAIMLRRTYKDKMLNEPLVKLPQTAKVDCFVDLNPIERRVYEILQVRIIERINQGVQDGSLERNYSHYFIFLLRLRQMTSHILLVEDCMRDLLTKEDVREIQHVAAIEERDLPDRDQYHTILELRRVLKAHEQWKLDSAEDINFEPAEFEKEPFEILTDTNIGHAYGLTYKFQQYLEKLRGEKRWQEAQETMKCSRCHADPAEEPYITDCRHIYCKTCLYGMKVQASITASGRARCSVCSTEFSTAIVYKELSRQDMLSRAASSNDDDTDQSSQVSSRKKIGKDKSKAKKKQIPLWQEDEDPLPSSKTIAVKAQVLNWIASDPKVKIIIFTQFVPMIGILTRMCETEGWTCIQFYGGISLEERALNVDAFARHEGPCIFLSSLKCGGVGLNLTMASKVINLDPWWNWAIEQQAFGRVFRIGQDQKTTLSRMFARDTVDVKILDMQNTKQKNIDAIMDPEVNVRNTKMTIKELISLFGNLTEDKQGNFVLVPDDTTRSPIFDDDAYQTWGDEANSMSTRRH